MVQNPKILNNIQKYWKLNKEIKNIIISWILDDFKQFLKAYLYPCTAATTTTTKQHYKLIFQHLKSIYL